MRKLSLLLIVSLLVLSGCRSEPERDVAVEIDFAAEEQAIRAVVEELKRGYEQEDVGIWEGIISQDPGLLFIGIGERHYFEGWDALRLGLEEEWGAVADVQVTVRDLEIHILPDGMHAWSTCLFDWQATAGGEMLYVPCRQTAIYEKQAGEWVMLHFHDSVGTL